MRKQVEKDGFLYFSQLAKEICVIYKSLLLYPWLRPWVSYLFAGTSRYRWGREGPAISSDDMGTPHPLLSGSNGFRPGGLRPISTSLCRSTTTRRWAFRGCYDHSRR